MINKVTLIGNLGKDPEIRNLENGVSVAKLVMATNENYKDRTGQWQKSTEWHDVILWRNLAERSKVLRKGMLIYVEGKLSHRKWTDKEGKDHYNTEIVAETVRILEKREGPHPAEKSEQSFTPQKEEEDFPRDSAEDDLPF